MNDLKLARIAYIRENYKTFDEMRIIALENNVVDDRTAIGLWLKREGYKKHRIMIDNVSRLFYSRE